MATVCRLSRSVLFPPQFKSLQEWFHYAFASSEIDGMLNPYEGLFYLYPFISITLYTTRLCLSSSLYSGR